MSVKTWKDRLNWILRRGLAERELDEEIRAHLAIETRQRTEAGESPEAARAAARKDLGNELLIKEATRDVWRQRWLEDLVRDLGYGFRVLRKNPGLLQSRFLLWRWASAATRPCFPSSTLCCCARFLFVSPHA
jgi:hypothetical protein